MPGRTLLLLGCIFAATAASSQFDPGWSHLSPGTEITELRTPTSRTYSNGDGSFTAEIRPAGVSASSRAAAAFQSRRGSDSVSVSGTGYVHYISWHGIDYYYRYGPDMIYRISGGVDESWAKFDLSTIPDGSLVRDATLGWDQYEVFSSHIATTVRRVRVDPDSCTAEALFNAIDHGTIEAPSQTHSSIGWVNRPLNEAGIARIASCLVQDWIAFGIREDNSAEGAHAYGTEGGDLAPYLRVEYTAPDETDIQALSVELLTYPMVAQGEDTVQLTLANKGEHVSGACWAVASLGPGRESTRVGLLAVGETLSVRVAVPVPPIQDTMVVCRSWASDMADRTHSNDSTKLQCWSFPASTYAAEGFDELAFPPSGWAVVDSAGGIRGWSRASGSLGSHSGDGFASCMHESTGTGDDWLVSNMVYPSGDYVDSVGFFIRSMTGMQWDFLETWAFSAKRPPIRLVALEVPETTYTRFSVSLDKYDGDTVRVAFRYWSTLAVGGLCLDDIWFSRACAPPPDAVQRASTKLPDFGLAPNPSGRGVVTIRSALAVGKRRTVTIRDVVGRAVRTFVLDQSGIARLDLRGMPAGVYMARIEAGSQSLTRKLVITAR
jgi:hypothetical protein